MGVFEHFPYTNFHDLNLDWILKIIKELDSEVNTFIEQNVLSYADPIDWNITTQYAKNTVVVDPVTGTAYMSIAAVPAGILLTNTSYWQPIFNYQQTVTTMKEQIAAVDFGDGNAPQDIPIYTLFWYKNVLYRALRAIDAGSTVIVGTNAEHVTVEDAILAIKSAGDISRTAENIIDTATGDYTETAGDISRTAENIIDTATGDYTETAGDKTENYTNRTVTATGDILESVTGKKTVNAEDIILNTTNPLTYKEPTVLNSAFKAIPMKDPNGNEYEVLVNNNASLAYFPQIISYTDGEDITETLQTALNTGNVLLTGQGTATISNNIIIPNGTMLQGNNAYLKVADTFTDDYLINLGSEQTSGTRPTTAVKNIIINCNSLCNGINVVQQNAFIDTVCVIAPKTYGIAIYPAATSGSPADTNINNVNIFGLNAVSPIYDCGIYVNGTDCVINNVRTLGSTTGIHVTQYGGGCFIYYCHPLSYDSTVTGWDTSAGFKLDADAYLINCYSDNFRYGIELNNSAIVSGNNFYALWYSPYSSSQCYAIYVTGQYSKVNLQNIQYQFSHAHGIGTSQDRLDAEFVNNENSVFTMSNNTASNMDLTDPARYAPIANKLITSHIYVSHNADTFVFIIPPQSGFFNGTGTIDIIADEYNIMGIVVKNTGGYASIQNYGTFTSSGTNASVTLTLYRNSDNYTAYKITNVTNTNHYSFRIISTFGYVMPGGAITLDNWTEIGTEHTYSNATS